MSTCTNHKPLRKTCARCGKNKPLSLFCRERASPTGFRYSCKMCDQVRYRAYRENMGETLRRRNAERRRQNPHASREYSRRYRIRNRANSLIRNARVRAERFRLPFDLDKHAKKIQNRIDKKRCEFSGLPLRVQTGKHWNAPSLDRIDPKKGYVYKNIRVVCVAANGALGFWGERVLFHVIESTMKHRFRENFAGTETRSTRRSRRSSSARSSKRG